MNAKSMKPKHWTTILFCVGAVTGCGAADSLEESATKIGDFIPGHEYSLLEGFAPEATALRWETEEEIARCMRERGFEYVAHVSEFEVPDRAASPNPERFGFGDVYELLQLPERGTPLAELEPDNPNHEIRESLSPEEGEAYDLARWGVQSNPTDDSESANEAASQSCTSIAVESVYTVIDAFVHEFADELKDMRRRAETDSRIVELRDEWSRCMLEQGYAFETEKEARAYTLRQLAEIGAIHELEIGADGRVTFRMDPLDVDSGLYKTVEGLLQEDIALATASSQCREGHAEIYETVYAEYEQRFIGENKTALEAIQARKG